MNPEKFVGVPMTFEPEEPQHELRFATPNRWAKIPALAERLGVKPDDGGGELWLSLPDGRKYDLIAIINALLDRLDAASNR